MKIDRNVMTLSRHPQLSEELLSAYIDNEVTDEERTLIEAAIATDPVVAWQVESLRQTIQMLHVLPPLVLPRSFAIEAIVAEPQPLEAVVGLQRKAITPPKPTASRKEDPWWQSLAQFWQGGNLYLRNATAVAFTLLIVLFASDQLGTPYSQAVPQRAVATAPVAISSPAVVTNANATESPATESPATESLVAATSGALSEPTAQENAAVANESAAMADTQASPVASATLLPVPPAASAKRFQQEDTLDITGGSGADGSIGQGPPAQDSGGSLAMNPAADSSRTGMMQSQAISPLPSEQPIATPANSAAAAANQSTNEVLATATTEPVAVSAVEASMTEFAPITETVTETVMATPLVEQPTATQRVPAAATAPVAEDVERWLAWAQIMTVLFTVVLGSLWWRSKG